MGALPVGERRRRRNACELAIQNPAGLGASRLVALRDWLRPLVAELAPDAASLGVCLADDEALRRANRSYRGEDRPTDVLSFPGAPTPEGRHLGDILISLPTAERQARALGHSLQRELSELLLHGLLHCLGYDHARDRGEMDALEIELRARWLPAEGAP